LRALRSLAGNVKKRIYISNWTGLGNRLETLVLACMIQDRHGHAIFLDWPEKEALQVEATAAGRIAPWERLMGRKVRDFDEAQLASLAAVRVINLRASYGPRELQRRYVLPTAARLRAHPRAAAAIRETLARYGDRPAVAVHFRHGDFQVSGDLYDAVGHRHPVPGLWWYEHVMRAYANAYPQVYFVLGYNGEASTVAALTGKFETVSFPGVFDYAGLPGHPGLIRPGGHPVVDLFGLACCTTLIATPTSSYSHWAANMLGPRTRTLLPPPRTTRAQPAFGVADLHGCVVLDWREAAEAGRGVTPVDGDPPPPAPPQTGWL
jgi:hypothetical protein